MSGRDLPESLSSSTNSFSQEWCNAHEAGYQAYIRGEACEPPSVRLSEPWKLGWQRAQKLNNQD